MNYDTIEYYQKDRIGTIKLNRPERMNAVIEEMYMEIQDALRLAGSDDEVRTLILTGSVLKKGGVEKQAFCAGADLKKHSMGDRSHAQKREYITLAHETTRRLYTFPKPIIAAVNGPARGAGAEMALSCDFIFMAEDATIGFPETGLGSFVGGGVTYHLPRIIGLTRAKELIYSGKIIDGKTAMNIGLALRCLSSESLMKETRAFANDLSEKAPVSMEFAKKRLHQTPGLDIETVLALETEAILSCMDTEDWQEGIRSFNEKRKPIYKGK
ncbi:MAG: enoyl-CoA hydratase/isomerase family protein [Thermodesulfobacteriota bacterium]|nr:enoyl-CoA hydratase/isomerase family protein [Thermodesulfobacteriota bacterium]